MLEIIAIDQQNCELHLADNQGGWVSVRYGMAYPRLAHSAVLKRLVADLGMGNGNGNSSEPTVVQGGPEYGATCSLDGG